MRDLAVIFLGACLVNNLALDAMLGLPPVLATAKKIPVAIGMSLAMLLALTVATVLTYVLHYLVLLPQGMSGGVEIFCFILLIAAGIKTAEVLLHRYQPAVYQQIAVFVPLTIINSAALGAALLNLQGQHGLLGSLSFGLGAAMGYGLVLIAMAAMQERLLAADVPAPFRGVPINLITLGLMAMAFLGFNGLFSR